MRECVKKTIGADTYEFYQLPAGTSTRLLVRIAQVLGVPIAAGMGGGTEQAKKLLDKDIDLEKMVAALFERASEDTVMGIINTVLSQATHIGNAEGGKGDGELSKCFDQHFKGRLTHMFQVVAAAARVEYADFFEGLPALKDVLRKVTEKTTTPA